MDTIIALSSGQLPAGVAIVRLSGPKCQEFMRLVLNRGLKARKAELVTLRDFDAEKIDTGLGLWFPAPHSFTGEDVLEFHLHGSKAVVSKLLSLATSLPNIRLAEPGEFSRRAFANGKFDLTAAEGLGDLLEAETEAQRKVAIELAGGALGALYSSWQDQLLNARAMLEADIDFSDQDDVPGSVADKVWGELSVLRDEIFTHLEDYGRGERIRSGFRISLIGKPNTGKSSLLNALAGSERAIVSEEAGTTRDVVEVRLDLGGHLVLVRDTAGIRSGAGSVESEGIRRSYGAARDADLVLLLSDAQDWDWFVGEGYRNVLKVQTKIDLSGNSGDFDLAVSVVDKASFNGFSARLIEVINEKLEGSLQSAGLRDRYVDYLVGSLEHLDTSLTSDTPLELKAEELRLAAFRLGFLTGQHSVEDVLGRIFSSFCIGK